MTRINLSKEELAYLAALLSQQPWSKTLHRLRSKILAQPTTPTPRTESDSENQPQDSAADSTKS